MGFRSRVTTFLLGFFRDIPFVFRGFAIHINAHTFLAVSDGGPIGPPPELS